ncbi:MAG: transposase [Sedimenticola sp.]
MRLHVTYHKDTSPAISWLYCHFFVLHPLLVSYLRPSNIDGAKHAWAILALLTKRLRQEWPEVKVIFRGDSGFCRHRMLGWCESHDVKYIVGIARNKRLEQKVEPGMQVVEQLAELTGEKQREFFRLHYATKSWKRPRQVIAKLEVTDKGRNPRFIALIWKVTNEHSMRISTVPVVRWRIESKSSRWGYLQIAPVRTTGGQISSGYPSPAWLMC